LDELWQINVGSRFSAPMTFAAGSGQFVAIASGVSRFGKRSLINTPELKEQPTPPCFTYSGYNITSRLAA
jgi:hypothetical protein